VHFQPQMTRQTPKVHEVVTCIQLLTTIPNPPLQTTAQSILHGLSEFVETEVGAMAILEGVERLSLAS
jgi:hypothetical protein